MYAWQDAQKLVLSHPLSEATCSPLNTEFGQIAAALRGNLRGESSHRREPKRRGVAGWEQLTSSGRCVQVRKILCVTETGYSPCSMVNKGISTNGAMGPQILASMID